VLWLRLEIGVGHAEAMIIAKLQQALPILVYLANSKGTQAGRPRVMACTYSGFEVAREDEVFTTVDVLDGVSQVSVNIVFCFRCGCQGWGKGADEYNWSLKGMEAEGQQVF